MKRIFFAVVLLLTGLMPASAQYYAPYAGAQQTPGRAYNDKLSDIISAFEFIPRVLHPAIVVGTSTTTVSSYLTTMHGVLPARSPVIFKPGTYRLDTDVSLSGRMIHIDGVTFTGVGKILGAVDSRGHLVADKTGATSISAELAAAITNTASPCNISLAAGTYKISTAVTNSTRPCQIYGDVWGGTAFTTDDATIDLLTFTGAGTESEVNQINFTSSVIRTAGAFVKADTIRTRVRNVYATNGYIGIDFTNNTTLSSAAYIECRNMTPQATSTGGGCVTVGRAAGGTSSPDTVILSYITNAVDNAANYPSYGIRLISGVTTQIYFPNLLQAYDNILIDVPTDAAVHAPLVIGGNADSAVNSNYRTRTTGTGIVTSAQVANMWAGTSLNDGFLLEGTVYGFTGNTLRAGTNAVVTVRVNSSTVSDVTITNSCFGNSAFAIFAVNGVSNIKLTGNNIGNCNGFAGNTNGIVLQGPTGNNISIQDNNLTGNITSNFAVTSAPLTGSGVDIGPTNLGIPAAIAQAFNYTNSVTPPTPESGHSKVYVDSTSKTLTVKNDAGTISNTVRPTAVVANQYVTAIGADGVVAQAQPAFSNLSGSATCAQMPALTGDLTTSAGACATTFATVNGTVGVFGGASTIPIVTANAKGLITSVTTATVVAPAGTLTGATLAAGVTASSLTSVGTITGGTWNVPANNINAANYALGTVSTSTIGTFGFVGSSNGPSIVMWGTAAAGVGAMEVYTNGSKRGQVTGSAGQWQFLTGTASTSTTTGTVAITGGMGASGAGYFGAEVTTGGSVVGSLPTCNAGRTGARYYVTDATAPTYLGALTGGGAVVSPVFCNGAAWVSG